MNKEVAKLWVDALRSGEYKQGTGKLARRGEFCCLGVLCELAIKNGIDLKVGKYGHWDDIITYNGADISLPDVVKEWAGMNSTSGVYGDQSGEHLSDQNDRGKSFLQIADLIEEKVEVL